MKCMIVGDTHFEDGPDGYLDAQLECLANLVKEIKPSTLFFLGDIFHHRKPTPTCIVKVLKCIKNLSYFHTTYILRGNHDSANKSDNEETILDVFSLGSDASVVKCNTYFDRANICFLPHYENEDTTIEFLKKVKLRKGSLTLGHVGFDGCMTIANDYTFKINKDLFEGQTILGHIHRYADHGNVKFLGTPWATNFGEADQKHYVGVIDWDVHAGTFKDMELVEVTHGPRYMILPYESLELYEEDLRSKSHYTLLRVLLNKFSEEPTVDLKAKITEKYNLKYVDFRFQPIYDKKLNSRLSDYDPQSALESINDSIIDKYLEEQKSSIPTEELKKGLEEINSYADPESKD